MKERERNKQNKTNIQGQGEGRVHTKGLETSQDRTTK